MAVKIPVLWYMYIQSLHFCTSYMVMGCLGDVLTEHQTGHLKCASSNLIHDNSILFSHF